MCFACALSFNLQAFNDLEELLDQYDICIAIKERLTKDSGVAEDSTYDNIVKKLTSKPNAKGKPCSLYKMQVNTLI